MLWVRLGPDEHGDPGGCGDLSGLPVCLAYTLNNPSPMRKAAFGLIRRQCFNSATKAGSPI